MSAIVLVRFQVDRAQFERVHGERGEEFRQVAEQGRAAGCLHHQFAAAGNEMIVVDEWESGAAFEKFFDNATVASLMADAGVQGPPEVTIYESVSTVDRF